MKNEWQSLKRKCSLHPSRPQNKRLYTPRTKYSSHTRQDRWIQTELAFTLAKNATKQNPVEIIPLQATRKENNCKTEETLARTFVTLETERIKPVQSLMFMMMVMMMMMMIRHSEIRPCIFYLKTFWDPTVHSHILKHSEIRLYIFYLKTFWDTTVHSHILKHSEIRPCIFYLKTFWNPILYILIF